MGGVPWWHEPYRLCRVLQSGDLSLLVHYPRWGGVVLLHYVPRCFRWQTPRDFEDAGMVFEVNMKKPTRLASAGARDAAPIDDVLDQYPLLAEQLVCTAYDGEPPGSRQTATLLIFGQDGTWKAALRDRQESRVLWVACSSLRAVFDTLEASLGDPTAVWRDDRMGGAPEAKRQKNQKPA